VLRLAFASALAIAIGVVATVLGLTWTLRGPPQPGAAARLPGSGFDGAARSEVDLAPHHLPAWVQTRQAASLWSGPDRQPVQLTRLDAWTFLKVTGADADRLQVQYAGDGAGRQASGGSGLDIGQ
jgi:hypothetical protein